MDTAPLPCLAPLGRSELRRAHQRGSQRRIEQRPFLEPSFAVEDDPERVRLYERLHTHARAQQAFYRARTEDDATIAALAKSAADQPERLLQWLETRYGEEATKIEILLEQPCLALEKQWGVA